MALLDEPRPEGRPSSADSGFLAAEIRLTKGAKKIGLMLLALAAQRFQAKLQDEQEVMGFFAAFSFAVIRGWVQRVAAR
jgi:hypothetical protein